MNRPPVHDSFLRVDQSATPTGGSPPRAGVAFADPFRPFAIAAYDRIADAIAGMPGLLDADTTRDSFISALGRQLGAVSERTLAAEPAMAGPGRHPADQDERRRLLGIASMRAADAALELLGRFTVDREAITTTLLGAADPGPVTAIEPGLGNPHQGGRSLTRLTFADGRKVMYRPRSVAAQRWFGGVLDWLNQRVPQACLRDAAVLSRPGYGWVEFIDHQPPAGLADVDKLYRRCGMLLAVLYALDAAGLEPWDIMASGDCPVPVSVEAVFHPDPPAPAATEDPAAALLAASVHRTGLLQAMSAPARRIGHQGHHDPADPETAMLAGFRVGYDTITAHRDEFARLAISARDLDVRFHSRPAGDYKRLLAAATAPGWRRLIPHELADLRAGDIPLLTSRPAARGVWTSAGVELSDVLDEPGLNRTLGKIARLNEVDRRDQEWIISATLAALRASGGHHTAAPAPESLTSIEAEPGRLLAIACGLADQIVSRSIASGSPPRSGRLNWLGLRPRPDGEWEVLPMGADLANGYLGVALYLAQLADLTGIGRYAEVARQALNAAPSLLMALNGQSELLVATGCGGYDGLSGISYGLARMANLLRDAQLGEWATTAAGLAAATATGPAARPGWADGTAGCLAAMMAVWSEVGSQDAASLSRTTARHLAELVDSTDGWCVPAGELPRQGGFAFGPAGIGWALTRYGTVTGDPAYLVAGRRAVGRAVCLAEATQDPATSWCRGTAGLLVARCCLTDEASAAQLRADVLTLRKRPVLPDLSLCHGELGITEALSIVSMTARVDTAPQWLRQRAGLLLDALHRYARYCGTPSGVSTPGLLNGLAGVGYGLLRLGYPDRVPAVLLLEPSPPAPTTQPVSANEDNDHHH